MTIAAKLQALGIELPQAAAPVAAYVPVVVHGGLAHLSGQLPFVDGKLVTGRLGEDVALEDGVVLERRGQGDVGARAGGGETEQQGKEEQGAHGLQGRNACSERPTVASADGEGTLIRAHRRLSPSKAV